MAAMERKPGIYDEKGVWLAPLEGNEPVKPAPERQCSHGRLCSECGKS